jgi:hypothetical protein
MSTNATVTMPTATIGNAVYTAKRFGQFPTITYANTALAGFETTSVDSNLNITIGIQSGVSTLTQVAAAIAASYSTNGSFVAKDLVSINISTHGSDTVTSCVSVPLAGGVTSSAKATLKVGPLLLTAVTAGSAGNSIRLKFTGGATAGSEMVTVSTDDITVQIADSVTTYSDPGINTTVGSTYAQILAALDASVSASALVDADSNGGSLTQYANVSTLSAFRNLTGGTDAAPATLTVQGITITSNTNDATQNGLTFTITDGATAGAEVVTLDASNDIFCQAQVGTSTVTQIVTALNGSTPFSALYTASGSASTHPASVYQKAMTGAVGSGGYGFYTDQTMTTLTTTYQYLPFLNTMGDITINNDDTAGSNQLSFSWDGINVQGILNPTQALTFEDGNRAGIYVKYNTGSPKFRITALAR